MSRRVSLGAFSTDAAASRAVTLRKLDHLPPLPSGAIYIPNDFSERPVAKGSVIENASASIAAVISLGAFFVWLLFF